MPNLDTYTPLLTAHTAAHLLRRATFGPTKQEIDSFIGLTATEAVAKLMSNVALTVNPSPPVDYYDTQPTAGQPFLNEPYNLPRQGNFNAFIRYWWVGLMCEQNGNPSVLEKLAAFWQNHFVVPQGVIGDYKKSFQFLKLLRTGCLKSFRTLIIEMTKNPGMLKFQNGDLNQKGWPNENYARELQELFVVGENDFAGNQNYTEDDVKAAAKVLTGWQVTTNSNGDSTAVFTPARHDTSDKTFSSKYNNKTIAGRSDASAGDAELAELIDMLLAHPHTGRFICRKLYRWYVNPNVTTDIEDNVIGPLASFFTSPANNFNIQPVLEKLLTSNIFYDNRNIGAIIKSPAEFAIGMVRLFGQEVPNHTTDYVAFRKFAEFVYWNMSGLQLDFLSQPLVFGSIPYYQSGYSKNWINGNTLGIRGAQIDKFVHPYIAIRPGSLIGIDFLAWVRALQPNFSDVAGTPSISCEYAFEQFSKYLFAIPLTQSQKDFLIDTIMMKNLPRATWTNELTNYRKNPTNINSSNAVMWRGQLVMRYMMRMAEYHIF
ncbi:DUF1800 family protein [Dyadobacter sp. CY347]|uniref:DUF1800 domain-containing protein n=1 Tax=Dyadobacter sp. CY347 TaxID=2909336 RepID=UPI001F34B675|nr:DUF1800 family protein [Dyadobacter sp. CY347]MCF2491101.1 DUF1800 domain-containing protein [Dyadobacter sp. CY347]